MAKRTFRRNIWGNVVGYEGGRRAHEFGCAVDAERVAEIWASGRTVHEARFLAHGIVPPPEIPIVDGPMILTRRGREALEAAGYKPGDKLEIVEDSK